MPNDNTNESTTTTATATRNRRGVEDFKAIIEAPITKEYTGMDKLADLVEIRKLVKDGTARAEKALEQSRTMLANIDKAMKEASNA